MATLTFACFAFASSVPALAQPARVTMLDFATGSEFENYLRALQVAGMAPIHPWSLRGFTRREVERLVAADSAGPWSLRHRLNTGRITAGPLTLGMTLNSAYPYGANDGPIWAGRGLTTAISGGVSGHLGPVSFAFAPVAFRAGNSAFELLPNGRFGNEIFNHGTLAPRIDLPQRFGNDPYSRLDPGASSIRFDSRFVTLGVSTANQWIGPATEYPYLLGANAPGIPHIFAGTGDPFSVWIARIHARVMWGVLDQSDYSPVSGSTRYLSRFEPGTVRLTTSAALVILPRGIQGLELGVGRFFHVPYRENEPSANFWAKPFKVFFLKNEYAGGDSTGRDNQLASIYFRWVFPRSGFELFGERGYEDQFYDLRELVQNPDHVREYMLGFQKVFRRGPKGLDVLKGELVNYQRSTLARLRLEGDVYAHATLAQGHTNRGQLLGASPGAGAAAASTVSWTRYTPQDRTTLLFRRIVRDQRGDFQLSGVVDPRGNDVIVATGLERMRFGRHVDLGAKVEVMQNYNRNFSHDQANLNLQLTARLRP